MPAPPRVAIAIPVYNGEAFLAQTLEDLAAQTFGDFEVLVCDNASTDGTEAIARAFAARDPRFRVLRSEVNIGSLPNFNRSFERAVPAPYFAWAAHDDRHAPTFLETLTRQLDAHPEAVLAYGRAATVDDAGHPLPYDTRLGGFRGPYGTFCADDRALEGGVEGPPGERFRRVLLSTMQNSLTYGLFRRSALERTSLHQFYGTDTLLLAEAALLGPFRYADAEVFQWRFHDGGTSFMDRDEWAERETGVAGFHPGLPIRALPRYLGAVHRARLGSRDAAVAYGAVVRFMAGGDRLRRLVLPGPHNYFGLKRWPWQRSLAQPTG